MYAHIVICDRCGAWEQMDYRAPVGAGGQGQREHVPPLGWGVTTGGHNVCPPCREEYEQITKHFWSHAVLHPLSDDGPPYGKDVGAAKRSRDNAAKACARRLREEP